MEIPRDELNRQITHGKEGQGFDRHWGAVESRVSSCDREPDRPSSHTIMLGQARLMLRDGFLGIPLHCFDRIELCVVITPDGI